MDETVVEPVVVENSDNSLANPPDKSENTSPPVLKKGRPAGSKDKQKRVVKPRKIVIQEVATEPPIGTNSPLPKKTKSNPTPAQLDSSSSSAPQIEYVDRFVEYSPRTHIRIAHIHMQEEHRSRQDARKQHWSDTIMRSLR